MKKIKSTIPFRLLAAVILGLSIPAVIFAAVNDYHITGYTWVRAGSSNTFSTGPSFSVGNVNHSAYARTGTVGYYLTSPGADSLVVGRYNASVGSAYFVIGNGTSTSNRKNALEVYSNGKIVIQPQGDISMGIFD